MANWQERMRQMQEEERRKLLTREEEAKIDLQARQEARLQEEASRIDQQARREEARIHSLEVANSRARADNEKKIKFFEILDKLNVRHALEAIRREVWQNQGTVIDKKQTLADS